jgi:hypothetical protein
MSVVSTSGPESSSVRPDPLDAPHVHAWELRAVEFDTWGRVSYYECLGCPDVRYV